MILRKFRLQKGLSQEQLSAMSGVSTRTIQRIERGAGVSTETLKCLAATLEIDFTDLRPEDAMTAQQNGLSDAERDALEYVRDIKGFYAHALQFAVTIAILAGLNLWLTPQFLWVGFVAIGWGIGLVAHGLAVFEVVSLWGPDWERRQVERRLRRAERHAAARNSRGGS